MSDVEADLREQFTRAFEGADYPVESQIELVPALPEGPGTRFSAGDFSMSAMEMGMALSDVQEFPYDDVEELVDDLLEGLRGKDLLPPG
jgi:hypothetical protein